MVRNFFLVSYKLKTNFVPIENRKSCSLGACCACVSDLARKPRDRERQSSLSYECSTNFILERNSFRNESHSGIISTAPRCMNELFVLIFHFKIWFFQVPHFDYLSILYIVVYMERYMWIIISIYRGYYKVARRYEFYFRVTKQYFTNERSEWVKYCFWHEKIKFISSSRRVMFFLLHRQNNKIIEGNDQNYVIDKLTCEIMENKPLGFRM